ncbi:ROK family protein [Candidatus Saganbacteria bacterium]|nr:ROK family protein [Candidatus Saganbacteria bacterium]
MKKYFAGIDIGGTKIASAIADSNGKIVSDINVPTHADQGKTKVIANIIKSVKTLIAGNKVKVSAIGIGAPGPIIYDKGIIINPPNLSGWKKVNLKSILEDEFNMPVYVDNDANCAALGEALFGAGVNAKDFLYITVSTGIGGGIIIDRKIYRGKNGSAGEFGHMIIDPSGYKCGCGNYGDLEAMASGTSIRKRSGDDAMAIHIKAGQGDKKALKVIDETTKYLGMGLANLINIFNPELVVVGGGLSNMGELLLKPTRKYAKEYSLPLPYSSVKIVRAKLGSNSGVMGAIALCL